MLQARAVRESVPLPEYLAYELAFREAPVVVKLTTTVTERGQSRDLTLDVVSPRLRKSGGLRRALRRMMFPAGIRGCRNPVESTLEIYSIYL